MLPNSTSIKIYKGDNRQVIRENVFDNSIDLVVTSPPYDDLRTYGDTCDWNFEVFKDLASELMRIVKPGGVVVWVVNDATVDGSETGSSFRQALYFKDIGFKLHDTMIWRKESAPFQHPNRYIGVFEYMFVFSKILCPKTVNILKDRKNSCAGQSGGGGERNKDGSIKKKNRAIVKECGARFNVWEIYSQRTSDKFHPAPFPLELAYSHIVSWSNPGDLVLDPFLGSGTTGVMAVKAGRNFIGIEKNPEYYEYCKARLRV